MVQSNITTGTANSDDSSTSWMAPSSSQLSWGIPTSPSSFQAQRPPLAIQRAQSPNPRSQMSNSAIPRDAIGWGVNPEMAEGSSTPGSAVPSPVIMSKEEKALEMTRRKEERKQVCFKQGF